MELLLCCWYVAYLAGNTHADIALAVNQAANFIHHSQQVHAEAIKCICRYLQGTHNKGLLLHPSSTFILDCYIDADFAGLWGYEDDQDPVCV